MEYSVWSVPSALRTKGGLSPLTSNVKAPLLLLAAVFSRAGMEESLTETVLVPAVSSDAMPVTVAAAVGESFEPTPQPAITKLNITAHATRRVRMFFLIIYISFLKLGLCTFRARALLYFLNALFYSCTLFV